MNHEIVTRIAKAAELVSSYASNHEARESAFKAYTLAKESRKDALGKAREYIRALKADLKEKPAKDRARRSLVEKLIESGLKKQRVSDLLKECGWPSGKKTPAKRVQEEADTEAGEENDGSPRYKASDEALQAGFAWVESFEKDSLSQQYKLARALAVSLKNQIAALKA